MRLATTYPSVSYGDHDVVLRNCEALGFPVPLVAFVPGSGHNAGTTETNRPQAGSRRDVMLSRNNVDATFVSRTDVPYPVLAMGSSVAAANRATITPNVYIANDISVFCVMTPRRQSSGVDVCAVGKRQDGTGTPDEWMLGMNYGGGSPTDYRPYFDIAIGATTYTVRDTGSQWAVGGREVLCGTRAGASQRLYRNGAIVATSEACGTGAINNVRSQIDIGQITFGPSLNTQADYEIVLIFDKALTPDQVAALTADPFLLFDDMDDAEVFGTRNSINTQSLTHGLVLIQEVALPPGLETTVSETLGRIAYGGRQITRIGSRIYTVAADTVNNKTYCFYSDDTGNSWTQELVVNYAAVSASISQGAGSQPVLALVAEGSSEIRPYLRTSGGGWSHKTDVGTGAATSVYSHQILYDGTNYHLIYSRIRSSDSVRQVRAAISSNLTSWTHTNIDNGDDNGRGSHQDKAIAACIDQAGDIHMVYTQVTSDRFKLRYKKRTSGTWGTIELLQDLGSDSNNDNRAIHLCIATDRNNKPYVVGCKNYSGNWKVFIQDKVSGSWSSEEVPVDANTDMRFPSLGFQDRQYPTIVFAADYEDGTINKILKRNSVWVRSIISDDTGVDAAEQVYDPRFSNAIAEQGSFIVFQASIIVFVTSTLVWGDTGVASGDANFSQNIHLLGRDHVTHGLEMESVLSDPNFNYTHSVAHLMPFSHVVGFVADRLRTMYRDLFMGQDIGYMVTNGGVTQSFPALSHRVSFSDSVTGTRTRVQSVTHSLVMSQVGPGLDYQQEIIDEVELGQSLDVQRTLSLTVASGLSMSDVVFLNKSVNVSVTHELTMSQGVIRLRSWSYNSTHYDPGWAAEYEADILDFVIMGPDEAPTLSMTLPKPDFGDEDTLSWRADSVRRNRTGQAKVFRAPIYESYRFTWSGFLRKRAAEFRNLIKFLQGKNVRIRDHNGVWKHVVISGASMTSSQSGPEFCNVELTVEEKSSVA